MNWNKEPAKLKDSCFLEVRPDYAAKVESGDIIVAGSNFGCGSARQAAPIAIRMTGVDIVIATSFARTFYRNSINVGLFALESPEATARVADGDIVAVDLENGLISNISKEEKYTFQPIPSFKRNTSSWRPGPLCETPISR